MGLDVTGRYRYPPPDPTWLAQCDEVVLEPELRIVDAHHHLWTEGGRPYLLDALTDDLASGHDVVATVFVQAHYSYRTAGPEALRPVGETERVEAIRANAKARGLDVAAAIVGFADLTRGEAVAEVLDAHAAASPAFRGVRHSVARDEAFPDGIVIRPAPAGLLNSPAYRAGLREVARAGLSYDAMLYHVQLDELVETARALPDLPIILDHFGCVLGVGPHAADRDELLARWRADMRRLADCPNVTVKLGGLGMIVCGAQWHLADRPPSSRTLAKAWRPLFDPCIDLFGPERCMVESNFPVDKAMWSYRTLWNAFKLLSSDLSVDERAALFEATARRVYRISAQ